MNCVVVHSGGLPTSYAAVCRQVLETAEFPPASYQLSAGSRRWVVFHQDMWHATQSSSPTSRRRRVGCFFFVFVPQTRIAQKRKKFIIHTTVDIYLLLLLVPSLVHNPPARPHPNKESQGFLGRDGREDNANGDGPSCHLRPSYME
jgi:hypothetical protein